MPSDLRPWWGRFTLIQLATASVILVAVLSAVWISASGYLPLMSARCAIGYLVVIGAWTTRRVAAATAVVLEERNAGVVDVPYAVGRIAEAAMLPLYCAGVLLLVAIIVGNPPEIRLGSVLQELYGTLSYIGAGAVGMLASAIVILSIWRRQGRAGWIAVAAAQAAGAAVVAAGFFLSLAGLRSAESFDTWYSWPVGPALLWLGFLTICVLLGALAVVRLWHLTERDGLVPWATVLFLMIVIGYLAGLGRLTGGWLSSWLYGGFFLARISTYGLFVFEAKEGPTYRSGWFASYLTALILCVAATAHTILFGDFAMVMQPLLMMPIPPVDMVGSPWAFGPSLLLTLTRDMLFLLWLSRLHSGWGEAIGVVVLLLLYWPVAMALAILGWDFLFPVLYPLSVTALVDLIWPLGMIGILLALNLQVKRQPPITNSLA
jgi:hypothetical protein